MAAESTTTIISEVTGLGENRVFTDKFSTTTTPTLAAKNRQIQAVADTDEILNLCGISTIEKICLTCITNDVDLDLDYVSSFDADLTVPEGESVVITKPAGVVRIKNNDSAEQSTIDVLIVGSA